MRSKYFQLRGTSGTGKTTATRKLMKFTGAEPDYIHEGEFNSIKKIPDGKVLAYRGTYTVDSVEVPIIYLGNYENTCGGCDGIPSVHIVASLLKEYATTEQCIVYMEGLMISHMLGTLGAAQAELGRQNGILAFLDTPLDLALERVQKRRDERGDKRKFNPDNTIKDYRAVELSKANAERQGYRVRTVPHDSPTVFIMGYMDALVEEMHNGGT